MFKLPVYISRVSDTNKLSACATLDSGMRNIAIEDPDGSRGSKYALTTVNRSDSITSWNWFIGQSLDMSCIRNNPLSSYEVTGKFKLRDSDGNDVSCEKGKPLEEEGSFPALKFKRRMYIDGKIINHDDLIDMIGYLESNDDGSWFKFSFEIAMPEDIADISERKLWLDIFYRVVNIIFSTNSFIVSPSVLAMSFVSHFIY